MVRLIYSFHIVSRALSEFDWGRNCVWVRILLLLLLFTFYLPRCPRFTTFPTPRGSGGDGAGIYPEICAMALTEQEPNFVPFHFQVSIGNNRVSLYDFGARMICVCVRGAMVLYKSNRRGWVLVEPLHCVVSRSWKLLLLSSAPESFVDSTPKMLF